MHKIISTKLRVDPIQVFQVLLQQPINVDTTIILLLKKVTDN